MRPPASVVRLRLRQSSVVPSIEPSRRSLGLVAGHDAIQVGMWVAPLGDSPTRTNAEAHDSVVSAYFLTALLILYSPSPQIVRPIWGIHYPPNGGFADLWAWRIFSSLVVFPPPLPSDSCPAPARLQIRRLWPPCQIQPDRSGTFYFSTPLTRCRPTCQLHLHQSQQPTCNQAITFRNGLLPGLVLQESLDILQRPASLARPAPLAIEPGRALTQP